MSGKGCDGYIAVCVMTLALIILFTKAALVILLIFEIIAGILWIVYWAMDYRK